MVNLRGGGGVSCFAYNYHGLQNLKIRWCRVAMVYRVHYLFCVSLHVRYCLFGHIYNALCECS